MENMNQKYSADKGDKYKIAVIGDTSAGKTMLLLGLIMTSKKTLTKRLTVVSEDHQDEIAEMRKQLQKGNIPAGTTNLTTYNLDLQITGLWGRKASIYPLVFRDYKGGDIQNGISFFDQKLGDCDGVLFLMNPGQPVLNLGKAEDADDATLSMLTNLINGISGGNGDRKCRAIAMAAAVTAMDRIRKGGDLYADRKKFFDAFNRYIVNPLKNNANGIACKTDFKISVTGHVESQEKIKIIPHNNAADPFLWLIDRIERQKHPFRYWTRRLWPVLLSVSLAAIGCLTWRCQYSDIDRIQGEGEYKFNRAQVAFDDSATSIGYRKDYVKCLSNYVSKLEKKLIIFPDVRMKRDVAYTNLLSKYLQVEADAAFLDMKKRVSDKLDPQDDQAYALQISYPDCMVSAPEVFNHYKVLGYTQEVVNAAKRLDEHRKKKVPEVVSGYNERYFKAKFNMLETNAAQWASHEYIQGLTNQLAVWKRESSVTAPLSDKIEEITSLFTNCCPAWRVQYASNVVFRVANFGHNVRDNPDQIFAERSKIGRELRKLLATEEPILQVELDKAKATLIKDCRTSYFRLGKFKKDAREYPSDDNLTANLMSLLQCTSLTNCVAAWKSNLHNLQFDWLWAEYGRVKYRVEKATDYSDFFADPRMGTGAQVNNFLACVAKWAKEEKDAKKQTTFDHACTNVWDQFRERYFANQKWMLGNDFEYPKTEPNLKEKVSSFLEGTRIPNEGQYDKWVSTTRERQKRWLIQAMARCKEEFKSFDSEYNNCGEISRVLEASQSFVNEMLSGNEEDRKRVGEVKTERDDLVSAIKEIYFNDKEFGPSYPFSKPEESWKSSYGDAEKEIDDGLSRIFKAKDTGFDFVEVTNDWKRCLWQHERNWLFESKCICTNVAGKFNGKADTIIDFVTQHSGNPFLWLYVTGVKKESRDFGVSEFKEDIQAYANQATYAAELSTLEEQYRCLQVVALGLAQNAKSSRCQYEGLYDIFSLRHLWTNGVSACINERSPVGGRMGGNRILENAKELADKLDSWLSTEYNIKEVIVTLTHPDGVVQYRPRKWNKVQLNQDVFYFSVDKGSVGDIEFLPYPARIRKGFEGQAFKSCKESVEVNTKMRLKLFSNMSFSGGLREEYTRDDEEKGMSSDNPDPIGSEKDPVHWNVVIHVPHLRSAKGAPVESNKFEYKSRAGKWVNSLPSTQTAFLTVSVDGKVVGSTPYDRIDACIQKAQEMESDNSNDWKRRYCEAEERLEELNRILSEGGELDAGGQPR